MRQSRGADQPFDMRWSESLGLSYPGVMEPDLTVHALPEAIDELVEPVYPPYARLRDMCVPGTTVLDVGCGNGKVAQYLAKQGAVVDGIEPSDSRVETARSRCRYVSEQWAGPDFDDPNIGSNYDMVTFLDVLEHMPDPQTALQWASSRLAPGGALCALIPNSAHWSFRIKMLRGDWAYKDFGFFDRTHLRFFDPDTAALLKPPNLIQESLSYASFDRRPIRDLVNVRPRLFATHMFFVWRRV